MILSEINTNLYNINLNSLNNKNMIKNKQRNLTGNNSSHHENHKKSDDKKNKTKIMFINCQNLRRNNRLQNNSHTQTQNNLWYKSKQNSQFHKKKI